MYGSDTHRTLSIIKYIFHRHFTIRRYTRFFTLQVKAIALSFAAGIVQIQPSYRKFFLPDPIPVFSIGPKETGISQKIKAFYEKFAKI